MNAQPGAARARAKANGIQFGKVETAAILSGRVRQLTNPQAKLMYVLSGLLNDRTWSCHPSVDTLAWAMDKSRRQTQRILQQLEKQGWIAVMRGAGRGHASIYRVLTKGDTQNVTLSAREGQDGLMSKGDTSGSGKVTFGTQKGDNQMSPEQSLRNRNVDKASSLPSIVRRDRNTESMTRRTALARIEPMDRKQAPSGTQLIAFEESRGQIAEAFKAERAKQEADQRQRELDAQAHAERLKADGLERQRIRQACESLRRELALAEVDRMINLALDNLSPTARTAIKHRIEAGQDPFASEALVAEFVRVAQSQPTKTAPAPPT